MDAIEQLSAMLTMPAQLPQEKVLLDLFRFNKFRTGYLHHPDPDTAPALVMTLQLATLGVAKLAINPVFRRDRKLWPPFRCRICHLSGSTWVTYNLCG